MLSRPENTQTTPEYYEPEAAASDPEQHRLRVLIDEAATLRGLTIQLSLRLMAVAAASTDHERQQLCDEFLVLQSQFSDNMQLLFGDTAPEVEYRDHVVWIRKIAGADRERRAKLLKVETDIHEAMRLLERGETPSFTTAREFFDRNWPIVRDKMTEVIWDLWADLDKKKLEAMDRNVALQTTLQETLTDIKKFSSAIRMIAINSAVLATRPQDAGAGFQAISKEVKLLSEEIDASTNRAKTTIGGLV